MSRFFLRSALLAALLVAVLLAGLAEACPNCKEALAAQDPQQAGVVRGYFWSILFMMSMPFTLLSCFGGYFYWQVRRARAAAERAAASLASPVGALPELPDPAERLPSVHA